MNKFKMSNYLIHYGVKGMKWGVRKERSTSANGDKKKRGLSTGQKIAIGVAAAAVTGAVLYKTGSFDKMAAAGRRYANSRKAKKLGLELVKNPEKSSSNFDKAMSRMNEAFDSGRGLRNGKVITNKPANGLDDLPIRLRHTPNIQKGPTAGYAKDRFGETVYRTTSPKLARSSKRLMTPMGAEFESSARYHTKADKLSSAIFNKEATDVGKAASAKRVFDAKGDKAYKKYMSMYNETLSNGKLPRHYSTRRVPTLKSTASSRRGKDAFNKIQSSMSYRNLTYADLEKLDLF